MDNDPGYQWRQRNGCVTSIVEIPFIPVQLTAMDGISLYDDCVMLAYNKEVRSELPHPFRTCGENDQL